MIWPPTPLEKFRIRASDFASVVEMSSGDVLTLSADNSAALPRLRIKFHPAAMPATGPAL